MCEGHRLRALQVGITRHHRILVVLRGLDQRALQLTVSRQQFANGYLYTTASDRWRLVVTAAAGMQLFTQLADFVDKLAFHPAVNIFSIAFEDLLRD